MIDSIIASSHHYYLLFFESDKIKNWNNIPQLFNREYDCEIIVGTKSKGVGIYHMQLEYDIAYGSEVLLSANRSKNKSGITHFWYDFYYGKIDSNSNKWFLCYPYSKMSKLIERSFQDNRIGAKFFKSNVSKVLEFMKTKGQAKKTKVEKLGFAIDITKYTAEVKESANANKVSLIGVDPLNSKIYDVLNTSNDISIEPTALKVSCNQISGNNLDGSLSKHLELSFDRLGNFRFWLKRGTQTSSLSLIGSIFQYFNEIKSLELGSFLSSHTLLEDE